MSHHRMRTRRQNHEAVTDAKEVVRGMREMADVAERAAAAMQDVGPAITAVKDALPKLRGEGRVVMVNN